MSTKRLAILIDTDLHRRFKALVAEKGLDMSEVGRELIQDWVSKNELTFTEDKPIEPQKRRYVYGLD